MSDGFASDHDIIVRIDERVANIDDKITTHTDEIAALGASIVAHHALPAHAAIDARVRILETVKDRLMGGMVVIGALCTGSLIVSIIALFVEHH